jgi:hypothetical protein
MDENVEPRYTGIKREKAKYLV